VKLISVDYTTVWRVGIDVCDVIFDGGVQSCVTKCDKGKGVNFSLKLGDIIYGRSLLVPSIEVEFCMFCF